MFCTIIFKFVFHDVAFWIAIPFLRQNNFILFLQDLECLALQHFFFAFAVLIFIFCMNAAMRSIFPCMITPLIARVLINFIAIFTSVVNFIMNNKIDMVLLI